MPQDVTFDLPFETPVSEHPEFARARHLRWIRDMGPVHGKAGFEEHLTGLPGAAAALGSGGRATPGGPRVLPGRHG
ncbi:hypothetical protein [Streptomyces hyaluromycini]|uniref:hypothetical protein n=1 Tax=Streptomyces hyaluromycini TaxID=1377993 RepID=UPI000B5CDA45|nr:hypothetical protein [Streptomyces hyaluromycini]